MTMTADLIKQGTLKKASGLINYPRNEVSQDAQKLITLIAWVAQYTEKDENNLYFLRKGIVKNFIKGWRDSSNYTACHDAFNELYDQSIDWNHTGTDNSYEYGRMRLLISLLGPSDKGDYYAFEIHQKLEKVIENPRLYTQQAILMMMVLQKPDAAWSFYEIFLERLSRGETTLKQTVEEAKLMSGIAPTKYKKFSDFRRKVLQPIEKAISDKSDIKASFETYRSGRFIGGLTWTFEKKSWQPELFPSALDDLQAIVDDYKRRNKIIKRIEDPRETELIAEYAKWSVPRAIVEKAFEIMGVDGVRESMDYVLKKAEKKKLNDTQIGGFLADALRRTYGHKTPAEREKEAKREKQRAEKEEQASLEKERRQQEEGERLKKHNNLYVEFFKKSEDYQQELLTKFEKSLPAGVVKLFKESGIDSPVFKGQFIEFAEAYL